MNASAKTILKLHRWHRPSRKRNTHVRVRYLPLILLAALFAVPAHAPSAEDPRAHHITVTPTDVLEDCVVNEAGYNCEKKTVIGVPVAYGDEVNRDVVTVEIIEKDGEPTALAHTATYEITVTDEKDAVIASCLALAYRKRDKLPFLEEEI